MKNIVLLLFTAISLNAQPAWQAGLTIADTSLWAVELVELPDGDVLVLGRREFHEVFPGFPIEGYLTYGSYLARVDAGGQILWEQPALATGFLTAPEDINAHGRLPAPSVVVDAAAGTWSLPYTVYAGELPCSNPSESTFSTRPGLLRGSLATGAVLIDTVYELAGDCGLESIVRAFRHDGAVYAITQGMAGTRLLRFDDDQDDLSILPFPNSLLFVQDATRDPLTGDFMALGDNTQFEVAVLRTDESGAEQQSYVLTNVLIRLQAAPDGTGYYGWGPRPLGDSVYTELHRYDADMVHQWAYLTPNEITDVAAAPDGSVFVLEGSLSGLQQNFVRVVRFDAEGTPVAERDYPGEHLYPNSIVATGDSCYIFTTTTYDLFEHPDPAMVNVTADCMGLTTAAPEPQGATPQLTVSPNPAIEHATLRWNEPAPAGSVLEVHAADGRMVYSTIVAGKMAAELAVQAWPRGVYVVALRGVAGRSTMLLVR